MDKREHIVVLSRWMERNVLARIIHGIGLVLHDQGVRVMCCLAHTDEDFFNQWETLRKQDDVAGLVLLAPPMELLSRKIDEQDNPMVLCACGRDGADPSWRLASSISLDNEGAMISLLDHLVGQGCKDFVHLTGTPNLFDKKERMDAFVAYISEHDGLTGSVLAGGESRALAESRILDFLETCTTIPDAFVCFNDDIAAGVIDALRQRGLAVPNDVAVTGFDDREIAEFLNLTTVLVPPLTVGEETARLLEHHHDTNDSRVARTSHISLDLRLRLSSRFHGPGKKHPTSSHSALDLPYPPRH